MSGSDKVFDLETSLLPASRLVPKASSVRHVAFGLGVGLLTFLVLGGIAPWQQSVVGHGRVIAFAPLERQQTIEATIDGRLMRWEVQEGTRVAEGDVLAYLSDNDPDLYSRLEAEQAVTQERLDSYRSRLESVRSRFDAIRLAQAQAIQGARARVESLRGRVRASEQSVTAAEAELVQAAANLVRHRELIADGLVSQRELELAIAADARARAGRDATLANLDAIREELVGAEAAFRQTESQAQAENDNAEATVRSAETDHQAAAAALMRIDSRLARQSTQTVLSPRAGIVYRILANQGGEQVKAGDPLLTLVPDTAESAAELWVDGNDAPLIQPGRRVRLQFEGWPAVQFAGWPSVAVGTFGGRVSFVDATDDGQGNFRVVVLPDPNDEPWPQNRFLRQGVRAHGWVLLNTVRVGYEIWRQLNGFPPAINVPRPTSPEASSGPRRPTKNASGGSYGSSGSAYGGGGDESSY